MQDRMTDGSLDPGAAAGGSGDPVVHGPRSPYTRTAGYYAKSWRRYLRGSDPTDLPVARPTLALAGQALRDEVILSVSRNLGSAPTVAQVDLVDEEVRGAIRMYAESGWLEDPASFQTTPPPLTSVRLDPVGTRRRPVLHASFTSGYEPHPGEPGRDRWLGYAANHHVHAWVLRHDEPRPWVVGVHGTGMGRTRMDVMLFRAQKLHREYGLNVALPVLPLHGPRRGDVAGEGSFPSQNVLDNVHGTAQGVWDTRRMISWIRHEDGPDVPIGLISISVGGLIAAQVASLEDGLHCAILGVPVTDLADLMDRHSGPAPTPEQQHIVGLTKHLNTVVSPFTLTPRVPFKGRFIYAGLADRLIHPRYQVARLWEHWGRPQIEWYPGGHAGFFRSRPVQDFTDHALAQSGLIVPRESSPEPS